MLDRLQIRVTGVLLARVKSRGSLRLLTASDLHLQRQRTDVEGHPCMKVDVKISQLLIILTDCEAIQR